MLTEKEIEREFRLACVKACEKQGVPRPDVTVQAESTDDLLSLGQKMLDEMAAQGIVWMYEEAISLAAAAIAKRLSEGVAWEAVALGQKEGTAITLNFSDFEKKLYGSIDCYDEELKQQLDGQLVEVIVRKVEGTKDERED